MKKPIQIFKPGKRTAMNGAKLEISESDMVACAAAYDPAKHEAPLCVGHPKLNKPRFGGVATLDFSEGILNASPKDVLVEFAEWVERKMFPSVSASFWTPDAPGNPVPGVYYLRHVGFLGAMPPAVKGLNEHGISFADSEEGIVEFSELDFGGYDDMSVAKLFRNIREFFIGKFSQDEADRVLPDYQISSLEAAATEEIIEDRNESQAGAGGSASFSESRGDQVTPEQKVALEAENAKLKQQVADADERDRVARATASHAGHVSFAEGLVKEGKLLPVSKDVVIATMDFMADQESVVEFGEGDAKKPLLDAYKASLLANPKLVEFAEVSGATGDAAGVVNFAAPSGYGVDSDRLALHTKALVYQSANKTTYEAALAAVSQ